MGEALIEAQKAHQKNEVPVGAIVVKDGQIIGRGHNTKEAHQDVTQHAEIIAIQEASKNLENWHLDDCAIYVTLEPCAMCAGAITQSHISRVYYGVKEPKYGAHTSTVPVFDAALHPVDVFSGIRATECEEILTRFFENLR